MEKAVKVQIFSDCHLERHMAPQAIWSHVTPEAKIALVPGDIASRRFKVAAREIASKFDHVIAVMGNHDFANKSINWEPEVPENFHLLNPGVLELEDVVFIGATLWTDFNNADWFVMHSAQSNVEDFSSIRDFSAQVAYEQHRKQKQYIKLMLEKYRGRKVVVMTHFVPSYKLLNDHWKTPVYEMLNRYFSANCEDLIYCCDPGTTWVFGHTHNRVEETLADIQFICNPIGYRGKISEYQHTILEL